jgi:hypothetical protein
MGKWDFLENLTFDYENPKMQRLFEALKDLYLDKVGGQDVGDKGCELIEFSILLRDNCDESISHKAILWLSATDACVYYDDEVLGR